MEGTERAPDHSFRIALAGFAGLLILLAFSSRFVLVQILFDRVALPALVASAAAAAIFGTGALSRRTILRRLAPADPGFKAELALDFTLGYPIFGTVCFLAGHLTTSMLMMVTLLLCGIAAAAITIRDYHPCGRFQSLPLTPSSLVASISLGAGLLLSILSALLPASTLDEVAYHLAVPKTWILEGRVVELPLLSHSYFPLGIESADLPLLALLGDDGALASHLLHVGSALAASILLFRLLSREGNAPAALVATAGVVMTPALFLTAGWSWNEWPLLGSCIVLISQLSQATTEKENRMAIVALVVAGGITIKYTFLPFCVVAIAATLLRRSAGGIRTSMLTAAAAGMVGGSWFFLRNLLLTGNPVEPFFSRAAPEVSGYRSGNGVAETIAGWLFDGRFIDESLGITIVTLALFSVLSVARDESSAILRSIGLSCLAVTCALGLLAPSSRILVPFLAAAALAGATLMMGEGRAVRALRVMLSIGILIQTFLVAWFIDSLQPFSILSGRATDAQYLAATRKPFATAQAIDAAIPANGRVLVLGINELFWFSHRVRGGGNFDSPRITAFLERADLLARLRAEEITHIAVTPLGIATGKPISDRKRAERETVISAKGAENLQLLLSRHATQIAAGEGYAVYELR